MQKAAKLAAFCFLDELRYSNKSVWFLLLFGLGLITFLTLPALTGESSKMAGF